MRHPQLGHVRPGGRTAWLLLGALPSLLLAGCGGGGTGGGPAAGAGAQEMVIGGLITRVAGTTQASVTQSGQGAVVTGVAGGTVSSLAYAAAVATPANSATTLAQTRITYGRAGGQVYVMGADGASPTALTTSVPGGASIFPAWSPDGTKIAFSRYDPALGRYQLYTMFANGTGVTRISNGSSDELYPTWSPDGTKIAFQHYDAVLGRSQIWMMGANGGSPHTLDDGTSSDSTPAWSPDGGKIAFIRLDTAVNRSQIYTMVAAGGSVKNVTPYLTSYDLANPAWSPDGTKIAFSSKLGGEHYRIYVVRSDGLRFTSITSAAAEDFQPCYSPDGFRIAFSRKDATGHFQIYVASEDGTGAHRLSDGQSEDQWPNWGPYVKSRKFVGAGGVFGASASGFLVGQQGVAVSSLLVFNTITPNTAHLDVQGTTLPYQPNVVFTVSGDKLNALAYANGLTGQPVTVLNATSNATGAVVSFDANAGTVTGVFPYTSNKAVGHGGTPTPERSGDTLIYRGAFLGVWDGAGTNRSPQGASEVRLDARTGTLLSFR